MAEYDYAQRGHAVGAEAAQIDAGLRAHMNKVYTYLSGGLALAGVVAYIVGTNGALMQAIWSGPQKWAVILAPLALIFFMGARINKMSLTAAQGTYWLFTALMGLSMSTLLVVYGPTAIVKAFLITAIAFLALSLYGYTTKRSLSGMGSFLMMGLIGLILAMIVNWFLASPALHFAISVIGVLIFAGLTAYDTQRMKNEYLQMATAGAEGAMWLSKAAVMGALGLFLNFVNMMQFILALTGGNE
jgi:FtsH-binding integral membrane protein